MQVKYVGRADFTLVILSDRAIKLPVLRTALLLAEYAAYEDGTNAHPGQKNIARLLGYQDWAGQTARKAVQRYIAQLVARGYLVKVRSGRGDDRNSDVYRLCVPAEAEIPVRWEAANGTKAGSAEARHESANGTISGVHGDNFGVPMGQNINSQVPTSSSASSSRSSSSHQDHDDEDSKRASSLGGWPPNPLTTESGSTALGSADRGVTESRATPVKAASTASGNAGTDQAAEADQPPVRPAAPGLTEVRTAYDDIAVMDKFRGLDWVVFSRLVSQVPAEDRPDLLAALDDLTGGVPVGPFNLRKARESGYIVWMLKEKVSELLAAWRAMPEPELDEDDDDVRSEVRALVANGLDPAYDTDTANDYLERAVVLDTEHGLGMFGWINAQVSAWNSEQDRKQQLKEAAMDEGAA